MLSNFITESRPGVSFTNIMAAFIKCLMLLVFLVHLFDIAYGADGIANLASDLSKIQCQSEGMGCIYLGLRINPCCPGMYCKSTKFPIGVCVAQRDWGIHGVNLK